MKIMFSNTFAPPFEMEAIEMTEAEFSRVVDTKDSPDLISVGGRIYMNDYTCWGGYDGTCNCGSHPRKSWLELVPRQGYPGVYTTGSHLPGFGDDGDYDDEES